MAPAPRVLYLGPKGKRSIDSSIDAQVWMSSNQKNIARKHVQEMPEISWISRKSELAKLQYNPNDHTWGIFGCTKCYCYINLYASDDFWTPGHVSWGLLRHFLGILDRFLDHFWWKYWYFTSRLLKQSRIKYQYLHQKTKRPNSPIYLSGGPGNLFGGQGNM